MSLTLAARAVARRTLPLGLGLILTLTPGAPARCLAVEPLATAPIVRDREIVESRGSYESQGKPITIERFEPKAAGKYPAVLIVHGAGGMMIGGPVFREAARTLARQGYVAHVVHYFELTDTRIADKTAMKRHFPVWMKALADGITHVSKQPNVDPNRLGMLGYSLGSYLSLSLSMYDARILAVVEYFGGLPDSLVKEVKSLPPILILHGDADQVVPVAEAKALESLCKEKKIPHQVHVYSGQGHGFLGEPGADALRRCVAFFDAHVKTPDLAPKRAVSIVPKPEAYSAFLRGE